MSNAQYQFTMRGDNLADLQSFAPQMLNELRTIRSITDASSDQQNRGLQASIVYDRATAARFGITPQLIDNTLYDTFVPRQVPTMYTSLNQSHFIMEAAPQFWQSPEGLQDGNLTNKDKNPVPLSTIARWETTNAPPPTTHQSQFGAHHTLCTPKEGASSGRRVTRARISMPGARRISGSGIRNIAQRSANSPMAPTGPIAPPDELSSPGHRATEHDRRHPPRRTR